MIVLTDYFGTNRYSDVVTVIYTLYITQVRHKVRHYTRCAALDNMVLLGSAPFAARLRLLLGWARVSCPRGT